MLVHNFLQFLLKPCILNFYQTWLLKFGQFKPLVLIDIYSSCCPSRLLLANICISFRFLLILLYINNFLLFIILIIFTRIRYYIALRFRFSLFIDRDVSLLLILGIDQFIISIIIILFIMALRIIPFEALLVLEYKILLILNHLNT